MSRSTQFMGISQVAYQWLQDNAHKYPVIECPCCGSSKGGGLITQDTGEIVTGMFDEDVHRLRRYITQNGTVEEYIQAEPWSSGLCIFLALRYTDGDPIEESLWPQEDIDNC